MKLKVTNGRVAYRLQAGKDVVSAEMSATRAKNICAQGYTESDKYPGYPICAKEKFYFEGSVTKHKQEKESE